MESKQNWKLRYWIMGSYAVPILALIISAGLLFFNINTVSQRSQDLVSSYNVNSAINALATNVQSSTNSTVVVTDEGTKTVEKIVDAMKTIALNGQQISLTSNQQAIAVQQVVEAMNSLNNAARETASGISQIKVGTQRLNDAAQELKAVV
ncbi:MAG: hypothetical protein DCF22_21890 [Leptolyngbya sp.]|nr:MAG: hypothetical protein DCF22_21890 [Leptolyngbya sp.]